VADAARARLGIHLDATNRAEDVLLRAATAAAPVHAAAAVLRLIRPQPQRMLQLCAAAARPCPMLLLLVLLLCCRPVQRLARAVPRPPGKRSGRVLCSSVTGKIHKFSTFIPLSSTYWLGRPLPV
jgi:hypothetical protein